jgi:hypothetical protein
LCSPLLCMVQIITLLTIPFFSATSSDLSNPTLLPTTTPTLLPTTTPTLLPSIFECSAGFYRASLTSFECNPCPPGTYASTGGESVSDCLTCDYAHYAPSGSSSCTPCWSNPTNTHFYGGNLTSQSDCVCLPGWSGLNCDTDSCPDSLSLGSLGSLLIQSEITLKKYSSKFSPTDADQTRSATEYFDDLLSILVDDDGDGTITTTELLSALNTRSVYSAGMDSLPAWCTSAGAADKPCYATSVPRATMYNDGVQNYLYSEKHQFDGSGSPVLANMSSSFPDPSWTTTQCNTTTNSITTTWHYMKPEINFIPRVCLYRNGILLSQDAFDPKGALLNASVDSSNAVSNRRVYCVWAQHCVMRDGMCVYSPSGQISWNQSYECSVGLIFVSALLFNSLPHLRLCVGWDPGRSEAQAAHDRCGI